MRAVILGADGYLGWPTALRFSARGWDVAVVDNGVRRRLDQELGTASLVPIASFSERIAGWAALSGHRLRAYEGDLTDGAFVERLVQEVRPEVVVHFAEQRSAPYSMIDRAHAVYTQVNNVVGTLNLIYALAEHAPEAHLIKLGSMGEYGTPNIPIEEGFLEVTHRGRRDRLPFPKLPGSFYHCSKVHDSTNLLFACQNFGLRCTDINQGIVYGVETEETAADPRLATRFDYDAVFGTVLHRLCVQAVIGQPMTLYGGGGQIRGFLDLRDTVRCIELAALHPPAPGEYRVFNQFTEEFRLRDLAVWIQRLRPGAVMQAVPDPRTEALDHFYQAAHTQLESLGLIPHPLTDATLERLFHIVERNRTRIRPETLTPHIQWRQTRSYWSNLASAPPRDVAAWGGSVRSPGWSSPSEEPSLC
ncbi:MAG: NAD-dependent epimerase/dehydratase family protein [Firmicutes bacterium]|nr:NAD-dependent epimerase/dehydratase family protein [Bacillota bacterium]